MTENTSPQLIVRTMRFAPDDDGEMLPVYADLIQPDCDCRVVGDGTIQHPIRVRACDEHRAGMPAAWRAAKAPVR